MSVIYSEARFDDAQYLVSESVQKSKVGMASSALTQQASKTYPLAKALSAAGKVGNRRRRTHVVSPDLCGRSMWSYDS